MLKFDGYKLIKKLSFKLYLDHGFRKIYRDQNHDGYFFKINI
jgi:hypothetical protein